jgi:hypothetical protein
MERAAIGEAHRCLGGTGKCIPGALSRLDLLTTEIERAALLIAKAAGFRSEGCGPDEPAGALSFAVRDAALDLPGPR